MRALPAVDSERFKEVVTALVAAAGLSTEFSLHTLPGAANNKVFRVDTNGSSALLKIYFQHPDDKRDRLEAEFSFSKFAWESGIRCLAQPLGYDSENRMGLYDFVDGHQLQPHEVAADMIGQVLDFYRELNSRKFTPGAKHLPIASEGCFSVSGHLEYVERRLKALRQLEPTSALDREAALFIRTALSETWRDVARSVEVQGRKLGLALNEEIAQLDRCLSPSDFGFHNAILAPDGRLRFIDFEYAGWDDPARLVCDFFCQPAVPVPFEYYGPFVKGVVSGLSDAVRHRERIALLLPVYRVKWCCIFLNDFLPAGSARRSFAQGNLRDEQRKASQLEKARLALANISLEAAGQHTRPLFT